MAMPWPVYSLSAGRWGSRYLEADEFKQQRLWHYTEPAAREAWGSDYSRVRNSWPPLARLSPLALLSQACTLV